MVHGEAWLDNVPGREEDGSLPTSSWPVCKQENTIDASKQGIAYTMAYLVVWLPLAINVSGPGHWFFIFLACTFPWRTGHTISGVDA